MNEEPIKNIISVLKEAKEVLIFPHISMDGDSLGSSVALCRGLRKLGKSSYILLEDEIPEYLLFLEDGGYTSHDLNILLNPDICIALDCSEESRFPERGAVYHSGKVQIAIDHHANTVADADIEFIRSDAAATGELVFFLLKAMEKEFHTKIIDEKIAESIYIAIAKDTGNFVYSNTRKETHLIVAELFDYNLNIEKIGIKLYQNVRFEKLELTSKVISTTETFCNGKANIAYLTNEMMKKTGAVKDESEGFVEMLRDLKGIEISAIVKERCQGEYKVSLRSKTYGDVGAISAAFGGGGHKKAAGFTMTGTLDEVLNRTKEAICKKMES